MNRIRRSGVNGSSVSANKGFGKYKPQNEEPVRQLAGREKVEELLEIFGRYSPPSGFAWHDDHFDYKGLGRMLKGKKVTASDVENMSIALSHLGDDPELDRRRGLFLSKLINMSGDSDFTIHTTDLCGEAMGWLGVHNSKNLTIPGNAGAHVGLGMKKGTISIRGDAEGVGKRARGGVITVEGSISLYAGERLQGATIIVRGDCRHVGARFGLGMEGGKMVFEGSIYDKVGDGMSGGEIHLNGDMPYLGLGDIKGGNVYYRGELVLDK